MAKIEMMEYGDITQTTPLEESSDTKFDSVTARASVIDVFCGIGGLAHGFKKEGFSIACGIDIDEVCRYAFESNNDAPFIARDVSKISATTLNSYFHSEKTRVLVGCAPCQPFSLYNQKNSDPQWQLLFDFGELIATTKPEVVSMENVPRLTKFKGGQLFEAFVNTLENVGYHVWFSSIFCPDYGVPQNRTRLVLIASLLGEISLDPPTYKMCDYVTVRDAIGDSRKLEAGSTDREDPLHRASGLSPRNLERIRAAKPGGTWRDWDSELVTECHRKKTGRGYASVYGRMTWDKPSPTITTQFFGFGNGRFGHPEQDRAISLREGAILQSFPNDYRFVPPEVDVSFKGVGRMIGNAVPVLLSRAIARSIKRHLEECD